MADSTKKTTSKKAELSLEEQLVNAHNDLFESKKSHKAGELVNPKVLMSQRRDIARIKTAIQAQVSNVKESK